MEVTEMLHEKILAGILSLFVQDYVYVGRCERRLADAYLLTRVQEGLGRGLRRDLEVC